MPSVPPRNARGIRRAVKDVAARVAVFLETCDRAEMPARRDESGEFGLDELSLLAGEVEKSMASVKPNTVEEDAKHHDLYAGEVAGYQSARKRLRWAQLEDPEVTRTEVMLLFQR